MSYLLDTHTLLWSFRYYVNHESVCSYDRRTDHFRDEKSGTLGGIFVQFWYKIGTISLTRSRKSCNIRLRRRRISTSVVCKLPKLERRVRLPYPA